MKPGALVEWSYAADKSSVSASELVWSSIENRWVPAGGVSLLVSVSDGIMTLLSAYGLCRVADYARFFGMRGWPDDNTLVLRELAQVA